MTPWNRTKVKLREKSSEGYQKHKPKPGKAGNSYEGNKANAAKLIRLLADSSPKYITT